MHKKYKSDLIVFRIEALWINTLASSVGMYLSPGLKHMDSNSRTITNTQLFLTDN
jgi:hypothetical protein